jgi:O-antigen/teichoic acid export membrane protein
MKLEFSSIDTVEDNLSRSAVISTLWSGASHYWLFGLGIIKTVILARLVPPEYFGMVAIGQAWATYFSVFRFDFRTVVVTWEDESSRTLSVQFWLDNILSWSGLGLAAVCYWISPNVLFLVGEVPKHWSQNVWLAVFLSLLLIGVESLTSTPRYLIEKRLRHDILARLTIFHGVIGLIAAVVLAWQGYYLAAILVDVAIPVVVVGLGAAFVTRWYPRLVWDTSLARKLIEFGFTIWTTGLLGKIVFQIDDWLVGTITQTRNKVWMSSGILPESFYSRAYAAGKMPMDVFAGMIGQIALPLYSRSVARDTNTLKIAYKNLTWLLTNIIFLSGLFALTATEEVVTIILGPRWMDTVPLFRLMSGFILLRPLYQNACQLLLAVRKEKRMRRTVAYQAMFLIIVCPGAVFLWGAAGAAVSVSVMTVIGLWIADRYVGQELGWSTLEIYKLPALTCLIAYGMLQILSPWLPSMMWISAAIKGAICVILFALAIVIFERDRLRTVWNTVLSALKNQRKN